MPVAPPVGGVAQKAWSPIQRSLWQSASGSLGSLLVAQRIVQFPTPDGTGSYAGAVIESSDSAVRFDFNHPLAGQPVTFEVKLIGVL